MWGPGPKSRDAFIDFNRQFEDKLQRLGGEKWLCAHSYYTEDEFWAIYDRERYDRLRQKYRADYLPSIFDKVNINVEVERKHGTLL